MPAKGEGNTGESKPQGWKVRVRMILEAIGFFRVALMFKAYRHR